MFDFSKSTCRYVYSSLVLKCLTTLAPSLTLASSYRSPSGSGILNPVDLSYLYTPKTLPRGIIPATLWCYEYATHYFDPDTNPHAVGEDFGQVSKPFGAPEMNWTNGDTSAIARKHLRVSVQPGEEFVRDGYKYRCKKYTGKGAHMFRKKLSDKAIRLWFASAGAASPQACIHVFIACTHARTQACIHVFIACTHARTQACIHIFIACTQKTPKKRKAPNAAQQKPASPQACIHVFIACTHARTQACIHVFIACTQKTPKKGKAPNSTSTAAPTTPKASSRQTPKNKNAALTISEVQDNPRWVKCKQPLLTNKEMNVLQLQITDADIPQLNEWSKREYLPFARRVMQEYRGLQSSALHLNRR